MIDNLELIAVRSLPVITEPAALADLVVASFETDGINPLPGDVVVVAQKLVSKAEGTFVDLATVSPSPQALEIAESTGKDARLVDVILSESNRLVRVVGGHLITEHKLGYVCANAGVDTSNSGATGRAVLLPADPDASARGLRDELRRRYGAEVGVIISDTHGRPFRNGAIGVAIGIAGLEAIRSYVGETDLDGRTLRTSQEAVADELASAASLLMGQGAEGRPVVLVRGYQAEGVTGSFTDLIRDPGSDLFR